MRVARWLMMVVLVLGLVVSAAPTSRAQTPEGSGETAVLSAAGEPWSAEETDRWWGVVGAAVCGAELWLIRTQPVVGLNPYALAAGLAGCLLALMDAIK